MTIKEVSLQMVSFITKRKSKRKFKQRKNRFMVVFMKILTMKQTTKTTINQVVVEEMIYLNQQLLYLVAISRKHKNKILFKSKTKRKLFSKIWQTTFLIAKRLTISRLLLGEGAIPYSFIGIFIKSILFLVKVLREVLIFIVELLC